MKLAICKQPISNGGATFRIRKGALNDAKKNMQIHNEAGRMQRQKVQRCQTRLNEAIVERRQAREALINYTNTQQQQIAQQQEIIDEQQRRIAELEKRVAALERGHKEWKKKRKFDKISHCEKINKHMN